MDRQTDNEEPNLNQQSNKMVLLLDGAWTNETLFTVQQMPFLAFKAFCPSRIQHYEKDEPKPYQTLNYIQTPWIKLHLVTTLSVTIHAIKYLYNKKNSGAF